MAWSRTAKQVYADGPSGSPDQPKKSEIRPLLLQYENAIDSLTIMLSANSGAVKATKAALDAVVGSFHAGDVGVVFADTDDLNGTYTHNGTAWVGRKPLPVSAAQIAADAAAVDRALAEAARDASAASANSSSNSAGLSAAYAAQAAGSASGAALYKGYATKALATSDLSNIPANGFVRVFADESIGGMESVYQKVSGALTLVSPGGVRWPTPEEFQVVGNSGGAAGTNGAKISTWRDYLRVLALTGRVPAKTYSMSSDPFLGYSGGITIDVERGAKFTGAPFNFKDAEDIRVLNNALTLEYVDGAIDFQHKLTPRYHREIENKSTWLTGGDLDRSKYRALNFNTDVAYVQVAFPDGDTFTSFTPNFITTDGSGVVFNLPGDSNFYAAVVPVVGGDEVSAGFDEAGTFLRTALIWTTHGYYVFTANASGNGALNYKKIGTAVTGQQDIIWPQWGFYEDWKAQNAYWKILNVNGQEFVILLNDREVYRVKLTEGFITRMGFGGYSTTAAQFIVRNMTLRTAVNQPSGIKALSVLLVGDSITETIHGGWYKAFSDAVEGSMGATIASLTNYAIGGQTAAQQLTNLTTLGVPAGTNTAVVMVGTNNVQTGGDIDAFRADLESIVDALQGAGVEYILLVSETHFYPNTFDPGGGATSNYQNMPRFQAAVKWTAAKRGVGFMSMSEQTPSVFADLLSDPTKDSLLRDGIHPTAFLYIVMGEAIARWVLKVCVGSSITRRMKSAALHSSMMDRTWTIGSLNRVTISADGDVSLKIVVNNGIIDVNGNSLVMTLPANLWPAVQETWVCWAVSTDSPFTQKPVAITINGVGQVSLSGADTTIDQVIVEAFYTPAIIS